jgi:hypothetical protein
MAVVFVAWARWIAARLWGRSDRAPGWLGPDRDVLLLYAPIGLAAIAVGIALESWQDGCGFALFGLSLRLGAMRFLNLVREMRRRRPVTPEDRQRRIEERAERRRLRARAMERYGPPAR